MPDYGLIMENLEYYRSLNEQLVNMQKDYMKTAARRGWDESAESMNRLYHFGKGAKKIMSDNLELVKEFGDKSHDPETKRRTEGYIRALESIIEENTRIRKEFALGTAQISLN